MNASRAGSPSRVPTQPATQPAVGAPQPLTAEEQGLLESILGLGHPQISTEKFLVALALASKFPNKARPEFRALASALLKFVPDSGVLGLGFREVADAMKHLAHITDCESLSGLVDALLHSGARSSEHAAALVAAVWRYQPHQAGLLALTDSVVESACRSKPCNRMLDACARMLRCIADPDLRSQAARPLKLLLLGRVEAEVVTPPMLPTNTVQVLMALLDERPGNDEDLIDPLFRMLPGILNAMTIPFMDWDDSTQRFVEGGLPCLGFSDSRKRLLITMALRPREPENLPVIARLSRSIGDEQIRNEMLAAVYPAVVFAARWHEYPQRSIELFAEAIQIGGSNNADLLGALLGLDIARLDPANLDMLAVLTLQIDPDGLALRPGTEVRDRQNTLNPDQLIGGAPFIYPPDLIARRKVLHNACTRDINSQHVQAIVEALKVVPHDVARISQAYVGTSVQPSNWPWLLQTLAAARTSVSNPLTIWV